MDREDPDIALANQFILNSGLCCQEVENPCLKNLAVAIKSIRRSTRSHTSPPDPEMTCTDHPMSLERRCGRPFEEDYMKNRQISFLSLLESTHDTVDNYITPAFILCDTFKSFLGGLGKPSSGLEVRSPDASPSPPPSESIGGEFSPLSSENNDGECSQLTSDKESDEYRRLLEEQKRLKEQVEAQKHEFEHRLSIQRAELCSKHDNELSLRQIECDARIRAADQTKASSASEEDTHKITALNARIAKLEEEKARYRDMQEAVATNFRELKSLAHNAPIELATGERSAFAANEELDQMRAELRAMKEAMETARIAFNRIKQEMTTQINELKLEKDQKRQQHADISEKYDALQQDVDKMQSDWVKEKEQAEHIYNQTVYDLEQKIESLESQLSVQRGDLIESRETAQNNHSRICGELEARVDNLIARTLQLESENDYMTRRAETQRNETETLRQTNDSLMKSFGNTVEAVQARMSDLASFLINSRGGSSENLKSQLTSTDRPETRPCTLTLCKDDRSHTIEVPDDSLLQFAQHIMNRSKEDSDLQVYFQHGHTLKKSVCETVQQVVDNWKCARHCCFSSENAVTKTNREVSDTMLASNKRRKLSRAAKEDLPNPNLTLQRPKRTMRKPQSLMRRPVSLFTGVEAAVSQEETEAMNIDH